MGGDTLLDAGPIIFWGKGVEEVEEIESTAHRIVGGWERGREINRIYRVPICCHRIVGPIE